MTKSKKNQLHVESGNGSYEMNGAELVRRQEIGVLKGLSKEQIAKFEKLDSLGELRKRQLENKMILKEDIDKLRNPFKEFERKYSSSPKKSRVVINKTITGLKTAIKIASMEELRRKGPRTHDPNAGFIKKLLRWFGFHK